MSTIRIQDHALVFVVRKDGEPGLFLQKGVSKAHAIALMEMAAARLRSELGLPPPSPESYGNVGEQGDDDGG